MLSSTDSSRSSYRDSVGGDIRIRLVILLVLLAMKLMAVGNLLFRDHISPGWLLVGIVPGIVIGIIASRMHVISWDQEKKAVVSQMDIVGAIVLLLYVIYTIYGDDLVEAGLSNAGAASLIITSMAATTTFVRLRLTFHTVANLLREAGILRKETAS